MYSYNCVHNYSVFEQARACSNMLSYHSSTIALPRRQLPCLDDGLFSALVSACHVTQPLGPGPHLSARQFALGYTLTRSLAHSPAATTTAPAAAASSAVEISSAAAALTSHSIPSYGAPLPPHCPPFLTRYRVSLPRSLRAGTACA